MCCCSRGPAIFRGWVLVRFFVDRGDMFSSEFESENGVWMKYEEAKRLFPDEVDPGTVVGKLPNGTLLTYGELTRILDAKMGDVRIA